MTPDQVCANWADRGASIRLDSQSREGEKYVLVEGSRDSLRFLGELLIAQAEFESDCHFFIHPGGAGMRLFEPGTAFGLSVHRVPCEHGRL